MTAKNTARQAQRFFWLRAAPCAGPVIPLRQQVPQNPVCGRGIIWQAIGAAWHRIPAALRLARKTTRTLHPPHLPSLASRPVRQTGDNHLITSQRNHILQQLRSSTGRNIPFPFVSNFESPGMEMGNEADVAYGRDSRCSSVFGLSAPSGLRKR
jgi:hypothetical protein